MNIAATVRRHREQYPLFYCKAKDCLWRTQTRSGYSPCPKHPAQHPQEPKPTTTPQTTVETPA